MRCCPSTLQVGASLRCATGDDEAPCVLAARPGTAPRAEDLGLECRADENTGQLGVCLPTQTAEWAWSHDLRHQAGWLTCGRANNATVRVPPASITFELRCRRASPTLIVRHIRGYSAEWGRCRVEVRDAARGELLLNTTVDAYRQFPQHTIIESSMLPFDHAGSEGETTRVLVTLRPLDEQRPPPTARGWKSATPADAINRHCANKFRLHELVCY